MKQNEGNVSCARKNNIKNNLIAKRYEIKDFFSLSHIPNPLHYSVL